MSLLTKKGYVIFTRHGQRAPARSLIKSENIIWNDLVNIGSQLLNSVSASISISNHPNNFTPRDIVSFPFGCITNKGLTHMKHTGQKISDFFPSLKFIDSNDFLVYATNYQRTQASAQMFISGLLLPPSSIDSFSPSNASHLIPDYDSNSNKYNSSNDNHSKNKIPFIQIQVRNINNCAMSFYESSPVLVNRLLTETQLSEAFVQSESTVEIMIAKEQLIKYIPALSLGPVSGSTSRGHEASQMRFDWLGAFDYFNCREAHELPLVAGTEKYSEVVKKYMCLRYNYYYSHMEHLAEAAVPLLVDLEEAICSYNENSGYVSKNGSHGHDELQVNSNIKDRHQNGVSLTVFSGHDVTILALLYALKITAGNKSTEALTELKWPDYGSTLVFEFSEVNKEGVDEVIITPYLNLVPLFVNMGIDKSSYPSFSFSLRELRWLIKNLKTHVP